jgi:hypothetical protein
MLTMLIPGFESHFGYLVTEISVFFGNTDPICANTLERAFWVRFPSLANREKTRTKGLTALAPQVTLFFTLDGYIKNSCSTVENASVRGRCFRPFYTGNIIKQAFADEMRDFNEIAPACSAFLDSSFLQKRMPQSAVMGENMQKIGDWQSGRLYSRAGSAVTRVRVCLLRCLRGEH